MSINEEHIKSNSINNLFKGEPDVKHENHKSNMINHKSENLEWRNTGMDYKRPSKEFPENFET